MGAERKLHEDAAYGIIAVKSFHDGNNLLDRGSLGENDVLEVDADLLGGFCLHTNVDGGIWAVASLDDSEVGLETGELVFEGGDLVCDRLTDRPEGKRVRMTRWRRKNEYFAMRLPSITRAWEEEDMVMVRKKRRRTERTAQPLCMSVCPGSLYKSAYIHNHVLITVMKNKIKQNKITTFTGSETATMNGSFARRVLSASTAALLPGVRRSARPSRPLPFSTRPYSDQKSQPEDVSGPTPQPENAEVFVESQVLESLKKKEAEVHDLTVGLSPFFHVLPLTLFLQSRLRYLQADFLNLQRNAAREKEQQRDFAITRFAGDLLETVDVLALALKSVPPAALHSEPSSLTSSDIPSTPPPKSAQEYLAELYQGVEMTHRLLLSTLFKYHVKSFDPTGEKFDPNRHEALYQAPIPGKEPGTVLECQKTGYVIKDRLLRAAQVGVVQDAP